MKELLRSLHEGGRLPQQLVRLDDFAELTLVASIAAVAVRVVTPDELRIAVAHGLEVGVLAQTEDGEGALLRPVEAK